MNSQDLNSIYIKITILFLLVFLSCREETSFLYDVEPVTITGEGNGKHNLKSTTEFISIAYADIFGQGIASSTLQSLNVVYNAFGDKKLIEDRIIRGFLNDPAAIIPASVSVNNDTLLFISNTFKKFYNRQPNEFEKYYTLQLIKTEPFMSARVIYYALMTSDEYRYY